MKLERKRKENKHIISWEEGIFEGDGRREEDNIEMYLQGSGCEGEV
jgi:hypothetical protein